jgi:hypothetical protein
MILNKLSESLFTVSVDVPIILNLVEDIIIWALYFTVHGYIYVRRDWVIVLNSK